MTQGCGSISQKKGRAGDGGRFGFGFFFTSSDGGSKATNRGAVKALIINPVLQAQQSSRVFNPPAVTKKTGLPVGRKTRLDCGTRFRFRPWEESPTAGSHRSLVLAARRLITGQGAVLTHLKTPPSLWAEPAAWHRTEPQPRGRHHIKGATQSHHQRGETKTWL